MPCPEGDEQLRARFEELEKMGKNPDGPVARTRGHDFEDLLLDLFQAHDILLRRSFHTADNRSEQIDGAIRIDGRVALVEAKWTSENVAASELYAFLGKVEGKFTGTIGVFVSRLPLSSNFIGALRAGRRQSIIVIHGDDVPLLFGPNFALPDYLRECLHHISIDNEPHLSAHSFMSMQEQRTASEASSGQPSIQDLLNTLDNPAASDLIDPIVAQKSEALLEEEVIGLLRVFPNELLRLPTSSPLRPNIAKYVVSGVRRLPNDETDADRIFLGRILPTILSQSDYLPIVFAFSARLAHVSDELRASVSNALVEAWDKASGTFEDENRLVGSTEALWPSLVADAKHNLLSKFVDILNSHYRRPNFPQFELARKIVNAPENREMRDALIVDTLQEEYEKLLRDEDACDDKVRAWARRTVARSFTNAAGHIDELESIVAEVMKTLESTEGAG